MSTSIFAGMGEAPITGRGNYLTDGDYVLEIKKNQIVNTRNKGPAWIADFVVVSSSNDTHKPGDLRNWFQDMLADSAKGNCKAYIIAALGLDYFNPDQKIVADKEVIPRIEEIAEAAVGPSQYLAGKRIRLQVRTVQTRKGTPFSRHDWRPAT